MPGFNKWTVLDANYVNAKGEERKVFNPHNAQIPIIEDPSRFIICICGRRFGKSHLCGHDPLLPEVFRARSMATYLAEQGKRHEFWTVAPKYSDAEKTFRVFWNTCKRLGIPMDKKGCYYSPGTSSPMIVTLWDGAFIYQAKSAQDPDALVGEGLSGVHIDEAAKTKQLVWTQMLSPSLADFKGWCRMTTTPEGKNWVYDLYMDWIQPHTPNSNGYRIPSWYNTGYAGAPFPMPTIDADVKRMTQTMDDNPGFTSFEVIESLGLVVDEEIAIQANQLSIPEFNQEFGAEFTDFVGRVFKGFDTETHCRRLEFHNEDSWETVAAVDYGFTNPNVWLLIQIGPWGEINIIEEVYEKNLSPVEFAEEILRRGLVPDQCHTFYPDPASPGATKDVEAVFRRAGKRCRAQEHTGGEINDRLNLIRAVLKRRIPDNDLSMPQWVENPVKKDKMRPQLMIDHLACPMTAHEFGEYRYPKEKNEEVETSTKRYDTPMKKDDHTPEAFGRMMASRYYDHATQLGGGTRISAGNFARSFSKLALPDHGPNPAGILNTRLPKSRGGWGQMG